MLGELVVLRGAREIALPPSKKTRALLAYLVVANRRQRRDHLCRMFWEVPDDPRASLRWSLSKLRHIINQNGDEGCLKADRESVLFDTAKLDVDLLQVAHMTANEVRFLDTSRLENLAAMFRGQFLENLELPRCPVFEAWRTFHGDALDRTRSMILQALVERLRCEPERAFPMPKRYSLWTGPTSRFRWRYDHSRLRLESAQRNCDRSASKPGNKHQVKPSVPLRVAAKMSTGVPRRYIIAAAPMASVSPTRFRATARRCFARRTGCRICNTNGKARCGDTGSISFRAGIR
ncbi:hypothetical protein [Mesorhizobium sp. M5C.F.Ca.ET.164.01.1.1]|uniref:AfsR/SARP family transcriptional regulator n=1 Tax=Mesorhizobium sp. M5C.F.Ca.ET.164.01.1.1 TaxID=2563957 RepID=UPI00167BE533|nr:hypothetical protein [Mesorhizobium sp. M5C.F.Ca.ET.164.01.1.1]